MMRVLNWSSCKMFSTFTVAVSNRLSRLLEEIMSDDKENKVRQGYLLCFQLEEAVLLQFLIKLPIVFCS